VFGDDALDEVILDGGKGGCEPLADLRVEVTGGLVDKGGMYGADVLAAGHGNRLVGGRIDGTVAVFEAAEAVVPGYLVDLVILEEVLEAGACLGNEGQEASLVWVWVDEDMGIDHGTVRSAKALMNGDKEVGNDHQPPAARTVSEFESALRRPGAGKAFRRFRVAKLQRPSSESSKSVREVCQGVEMG
jgi:hypothetical protein